MGPCEEALLEEVTKLGTSATIVHAAARYPVLAAGFIQELLTERKALKKALGQLDWRYER